MCAGRLTHGAEEIMARMGSHAVKVLRKVHGPLPTRELTERMLARQERWESFAFGVTDDDSSDADGEISRYVEAHGADRGWAGD